MTQTEIDNVTRQMMQEWFSASEERKVAALNALRGETEPARKPADGPLLLGMGEAARLLGCSRATFWRILQAGTIKKVELFHGSFRVRRADLEGLAEGKFGVVTANGKDANSAVSSRLQKMLVAGARRRDPRFKELMALADGGDDGAAADLFKEFGFEYGAGKFTEKQTRRTDRTLATNGAEGGA